ncbi:hypothetical protein HAX54_035604, partial [Datura stramonium]|nr:hypothetical protein [Datura stramonium]
MGSIEMFVIDLGTTTFGDSLVGSGKIPMELYYWYAQSSVAHRRVSGSSRTPPATRRCFADAASALND